MTLLITHQMPSNSNENDKPSFIIYINIELFLYLKFIVVINDKILTINFGRKIEEVSFRIKMI